MKNLNQINKSIVSFDSKNLINNGLIGQAIDFLKLETLLLKYTKNEYINSLLNLVMKTNFVNDILVNLNYLKGLNHHEKLTQDEINKIKEISINYNEENFGRNYFINLIATKIVNINDLFQLIIIHTQRNFFNPLPEDRLNELKSYLTILEKEKEFPITNKENIKNLAIFGATYETQKQRLKYGLKIADENKLGYENLYLLTGFRKIYISELEQLKIISKENLKTIKDEYKKQNGKDINNLNAQELLSFTSKPENEKFLKLINTDILKNVLKNIVESNKKYETPVKDPTEEEKEHIAELSMTNKEIDSKTSSDLLKILINTQELDLFKLGAYELEVPSEKIKVVYSRELSASNIMNGQNVQKTVKRANTSDTLKALYDLDSNFENILFISNGPFVKQQEYSTLDIATEKDKSYLTSKFIQTTGSEAKYDDVKKTKAAQLFGLLPIVSRILKQHSPNSNLLGNSSVKSLANATIDKAYEIGQQQGKQSNISR